MTVEEMIEFVEKTKRSIKLTDKGSQYISDLFEAIAQREKDIEDGEKETRDFINDILNFLNTTMSEEVKVKKRPIKKRIK